MSERLWSFDNVVVGQRGPQTRVAITQSDITEFAVVSQHPDPPSNHAMPTMILSFAPLMRESIAAENGYTAYERSVTARRQTPFTQCEIRVYEAVVAGDIISADRYVLDKSVRRGSNFVTFRVEASNQDGTLVGEYDYTCIFDHVPAPKKHPVDSLVQAEVIDSIDIRETQETMNDRDAFRLVGKRGIGSNIHTDEEFARQSIFGSTVVSGPAMMAYVDHLVERGAPTSSLRRMMLKAIRPFRAGDTVTFARLSTDEIRGTNQHSTLVCVGEVDID
jgi:acyl dehydratase|tara:strand:+ start:524 stop:1351 length:828 start_codon:yes stop_codon:yes gene_type:complete